MVRPIKDYTRLQSKLITAEFGGTQIDYLPRIHNSIFVEPKKTKQRFKIPINEKKRLPYFHIQSIET